MDRGTYLALLMSHDESGSLEVPSGFDRQTEVDRLRRVAAALQVALHASLDIEADDQIQDATFCGQIILPQDVLVDPVPADEVAVLRMSNFGRFVAVSNEERVQPEVLAQIRQLLDENGFVLIPFSVLACRYTGAMSGLPEEATWWNRYFDWV